MMTQKMKNEVLVENILRTCCKLGDRWIKTKLVSYPSIASWQCSLKTVYGKRQIETVVTGSNRIIIYFHFSSCIKDRAQSTNDLSADHNCTNLNSKHGCTLAFLSHLHWSTVQFYFFVLFCHKINRLCQHLCNVITDSDITRIS